MRAEMHTTFQTGVAAATTHARGLFACLKILLPIWTAIYFCLMARTKQSVDTPNDVAYTWIYRFVLGFTMLPLLIFFATGFYFRFRDNWKIDQATPTPFLDRFAQIISWEAHVAFFLFSLIAVIWACAAPNWLERIMDKAVDKALSFAFSMIVLSVIYSWFS